MGRLTRPQTKLLTALSTGRGIVYSQDGDYGWLTDPKQRLDDFGISNAELQGLRDQGFIRHQTGDDEWVRFSPPEVITEAGRRALAQEQG